MMGMSDIEGDPEGRALGEDPDQTGLLSREDIVLVARVSGSLVVPTAQSLADLAGLMVAMLLVFLVQADKRRIQGAEFAEAPTRRSVGCISLLVTCWIDLMSLTC